MGTLGQRMRGHTSPPLLLLLAACLLSQGQASLGRTSYEGHQVLAVTPHTTDQLNLLRDWMTGDMGLDFWEEPHREGSRAVFMAPPSVLTEVKATLVVEGLGYDIVNDNVQRELDVMWADMDKRSAQRSANMAYDYDDFNTYDEIMAEVEVLRRDCASQGLICTTYSIGSSHEGRDITMLKISSGPGRKAYYLDATIHAREWLAPATILKTANQLVRNYNSDNNARRLVDKYDWYILPVMNPDSYVYSFTSRYWRKNRRPQGIGCTGVDLNRNFDFRWGREGVSTYPCSDIYCGSRGGSEPETQAVQDELLRLGSDILAMATFHAYGNMWMFPWGNTVNHDGWYCDRPDDFNDLMFVADATANAIQGTYNTRWSRGTSCEVIYETTGGTDDYAKGVAGIKYSFCPELRGNGFVVNRSDIDRSYREIFNGLVAMVDAISVREGV